MSRIALLGAGFSHNWHAPLAAEVMGDVLGRIAEDHNLSSLVGRFPNFEDALTVVQRQFDSGPNDATRKNLDRMQAAVHRGLQNAVPSVFSCFEGSSILRSFGESLRNRMLPFKSYQGSGDRYLPVAISAQRSRRAPRCTRVQPD